MGFDENSQLIDIIICNEEPSKKWAIRHDNGELWKMKRDI